jgi:hypothetical protein
MKCGIGGNDEIVTRCFQSTYWVVTFAYDIPDEGYGVGGFKKGSQLRTHWAPDWAANDISYFVGSGRHVIRNLDDHKVEKIVVETLERQRVVEREVVQKS